MDIEYWRLNETILARTYKEESSIYGRMPKEPAWKKCETDKMAADKARGCTIIPTGIGSDYAKFCKGEKPALVEVKSGTGKLTSAQKITKSTVTKVGWNYVEERCD